MGYSIGIDLGTTNSVAAYYENGEMNILPAAMNKDFTPSVVCYKPGQGKKKPEFIVGEAALRMAQLYPKRTVRSIKRLMGRYFNDPKVKELAKQVQYGIVEAKDPDIDQRAMIKLHNKKLSPEEISTMILDRIKANAEASLKASVTHAVITVPAYFEDRQRAATREAGEKAGLNVIQVIDEPTAAAIAYGTMLVEEEGRKTLVFDLGGGTFDISLVKFIGDTYKVDGYEGDNWLGGDDFDQEVISLILQKLDRPDIEELKKDSFFMTEMKALAEDAKIQLSESEEANVIGRCQTSDKQLISIHIQINRAEFEERIAPFIEKCMDKVESLLKNTHTTKDSIQDVLLVGGSTRIPLVQSRLEDFFGQDKIHNNIDPMHCVAQGAARLAASQLITCPNCQEALSDSFVDNCPHCDYLLKGEMPDNKGYTVDVSVPTSLDLGIQSVDEEDSSIFAVIIPQGTNYPLLKPIKRTFYPTEANQRLIRIPVFEGKGIKVSDVNVHPQGEIEIDVIDQLDLKSGLVIDQPIEISFDYSRDRILTVSVNVGSGKSHVQTLERKKVTIPRLEYNNLSEEPTEEKKAFFDEEDLRASLDIHIQKLQSFIQRQRNHLRDDWIPEMEKHILSAKGILIADPFDPALANIALSLLADDINGSGIASVIEQIDVMCSQAISKDLKKKLFEEKNNLIEENDTHGSYTYNYMNILDRIIENINEAHKEISVDPVAIKYKKNDLVRIAKEE